LDLFQGAKHPDKKYTSFGIQIHGISGYESTITAHGSFLQDRAVPRTATGGYALHHTHGQGYPPRLPQS
jgi:hypothetical protein